MVQCLVSLTQTGPHTEGARLLHRQVALFSISPGAALPGWSGGRGRPGQTVPVIIALISVVYKSLKPPHPGATSQGPAGGDGWYVFEWRRISPAFPLRVKGEPCVGGGRLARWVALPPAITLSWVTTQRWQTHQRRAQGGFSQTGTSDALLPAGEQYGL